MGTKIERIKILIEVNRLIAKTAGVDPAVSLSLTEAYNLLSVIYGIDLSKTSPKKLYGKPYCKLSLDEKSEYTQIKRTIRRGLQS